MPADILIRTAGINEKRALEQLQLRASLANDGDRDHILANPGIISIPEEQIRSGNVFLAERDRSLLGFAALQQDGLGNLELDGMFVEPTLWRSGVGRRLVEHCVSQARHMGATELALIANPHALTFYRKCRFEERGSVTTLFGPAIRMARCL